MAKVKKNTAPLSMDEGRHRAVLSRLLAYTLGTEKAAQSAMKLLDVFGNIAKIIKTPAKSLEQLGGLDPASAQLVALVGDAAQAALEDQAADIHRIYDTDSAVAAMSPRFMGRTTEAVGLLILDARGGVQYNNIVYEGGISEVPIYVRRLVQLCIEFDAESVLMAHNHPSGVPYPSRNDIVSSRKVELALRGIDVNMVDHLIFAQTDYFSFAESGLWEEGKEKSETFFRRELELSRYQEQQYLRKARESKTGK